MARIKLYTEKTTKNKPSSLIKLKDNCLEKILKTKYPKNSTNSTIKFIGLDLPKKLANIVSFYIFAAVKILKI
ncbi:hypothetical protein KUL156_17960 [Alteromonas sp. KUL156]|uniref:Uncharacterized protein n=1 Tax=Tenacibaculum sp. Pbs-1 TaxID=3238748 RepID=A0AB33L388_9FLAO|nr:hypothetical protein BACT7_08510 [Tenacibaculum mesophilum]GFD71697.1 hypothetical protein KUL113_11170 [Tenacibaculum sp. KUL113]GFD78623.1 hypothetical protein KUL118_14850 [Tenacibaculum sp. KUL118]GFD99203.1 hypothetical protein KUL156_17960 [Alteromonas sp. KUL156]